MVDFSFYNNKKVLVTGNTGFKGSWLSLMLRSFGADVVGYSLKPPTNPNIFEVCGLNDKIKTYYEDIRNFNTLKKCIELEKPEIIFHLAAQPIVRESYDNPLYTYECNVMGTVNILECIRLGGCSVNSFLNVTTDKVYRNNEWEWGYRENDVLDGYDPYSNSKSCSELITASYKRSFGDSISAVISTARAGNVIGGGDFANDRIVPDCIRAAENKDTIIVRNPNSIRPYQHVLEPLTAYLTIAAEQYADKSKSGCYNVGPNESECITTGTLADIFCEIWGEGIKWRTLQESGPHEANFLSLDCYRIKRKFGWRPVWSVKTAVEKTILWHKAYLNGENMYEFSHNQIIEYFSERI